MTSSPGLSRRTFVGAAGAALAAGPNRSATARDRDPDVEPAVRALYDRFVAAQNARDLDRVRALLWDEPDFLWVSDGRPFWGADTLLRRMASFQAAEVWTVTPDLGRSRVVALTADVAYLNVPLVLAIGAAASPSNLPWLVDVLCCRGPEGWRIAALFTTEDKSA